MIHRGMSIADLAALVCETLREQGISAVLTGGAVVSVYGHNPYESGDLDFISRSNRSTIAKAVERLGFSQDGRLFRHPDTDYFLDFPAPPLAIGDEPVPDEEIARQQRPTGTLTLLSPTHCVMDRLASYYFWDDLKAREQAVIVARNHPVNWGQVERWSKREGKLALYRKFKGDVDGQ